jgi:hypothetical protein
MLTVALLAASCGSSNEDTGDADQQDTRSVVALVSPTGGGLHVHRLHVGGSVGARQLAAHLRQVPDLGARG